MRLDKFLAESGLFSRSEAGRAVRGGRVSVGANVVKNPSLHIPEDAEVYCDGKRVYWTKYQYILLNKPAGVVSATEDGGRTVMDLLPPSCKRLDMFPCGRLDIDTTGLLLITNDGPGAHMWLSPKRHVTKTYRFTCDPALTEEGITKLETGVDLGDFTSAPAKVTADSGNLSGEICITEGKFHQIKRMFHGVGSEITALERVTFGPLTLDPNLERGQWRYLTEEEIAALRALL